MTTQEIKVICRTEEETNNLIKLNCIYPGLFTYVDDYQTLYNAFLQYINDLDEDDEDYKFKPDFDNPYASADADGFSRSCYENNNVLILTFIFNNNVFKDWYWDKCNLNKINFKNSTYVDYNIFMDIIEKHKDFKITEKLFVDNKINEIICENNEEPIYDIIIEKYGDFLRIDYELIRISSINYIDFKYNDLYIYGENDKYICLSTEDDYKYEEIEYAFYKVCDILKKS